VAALSLKERFNKVIDKGPDRWLSRTLPLNETNFRSRNFTNPNPPIADGVDPAPGGEQQGGGQEKPQVPQVTPARVNSPRGFGLTARRDMGKPDTQAVDRSMGSLQRVYHEAPARLRTDWEGLKAGSKEGEQAARDYAGHAMLYAQELSRRMKDPEDDLNIETPASGPGTKQLTYQEIQALLAHKERNIRLYGDASPNETQNLVTSTRPFGFSPEFIESSWNVIRGALHGETGGAFKSSGGFRGKELEDGSEAKPAGMRGLKINPRFFYAEEGEEFPTYHPPVLDRTKHYKQNGEVNAAGKGIQQLYDDFVTALQDSTLGQEFRGSGSDGEARARIMWKLFLEQGGMEALTGLPLDPRSMILEHTTPLNRSAGMNTNVDYPVEQTDTDSNFVLLNPGVNEYKSGGTMQEMYDKLESPTGPARITQDDYDRSAEQILAARGFQDEWTQQLLATLIDSEGNIIDGDHMAELETKLAGQAEKLEEYKANILGLYDKNVEVGRKPTAPSKKKNLTPEEQQYKEVDYPQQLAQWEEKGRQFDVGRRKYITDRAAKVGGLRDRWKTQLFSGLKLKKGITRIGGGNPHSAANRNKIIEHILTNINDVDNIRDSWREMTRRATEHVARIEEWRRENSSMLKAEQDIEIEERFGDKTGTKFFTDLLDEYLANYGQE
jgi:hypothetical protein